MDKEEFKKLLKNANFSKKSFASFVGLKYQSVNTWGNNNRAIPYWVKSWLNLYIENLKYQKVKDILKDSGVCKE
ncbi:hypothetical protein CRU92_11555 [Arcobacter sp. FW59]|nr:hypothetical protein CRU92_11555 [Arcobacter sp. FW59]